MTLAPPSVAETHLLAGKSVTPLAPRIIDVHTMVWDLLSCQSYFAQSGNPYSHFGTGWDGFRWVARQWQDLDFRAASDYHGNPFCVSIENADRGFGFPVWSGSDVPRFHPEQAEVLAQLIAWLCVRFGIPPHLVNDSLTTSVGPGWHRQGIDPWRLPAGVLYSSSYGKVCPGDRRIAQLRDEIMPRVRAIIQSWQNPAPPPTPSLEEDMEGVIYHPGNNTFWWFNTRPSPYIFQVFPEGWDDLTKLDQFEGVDIVTTLTAGFAGSFINGIAGEDVEPVIVENAPAPPS